MSIKKLPSGRWRVQIRRKHLRVDKVFDTESEAREAQQQYISVQKSPKGVTLQDAWQDYEQSFVFLKKKPRTQDTEASRIKRLLRKYGKHAAASITSEHVERYMSSRLKEAPQPSADAIRLEVAALSALMTHCRKRRWIAANPCIGVGRPTAEIKPRRMSREDEGALISLLGHSNFRFRAAARLCLLVRETGARPGEWRNAAYDDVDLDNSRVIFQNTKYKGQPRTVPLSEVALSLVLEQMQDTLSSRSGLFGVLLFPAPGRGDTVKPLHYTGALRDAKKASALPKRVRAHTGRHEFISTLLESTDLEDARIMALVGHHSPASMEVYKHVRNVRFLPHIEGLEPDRRRQRSRSLAASLNIPAQLINSYLEGRRNQDADCGDVGARDELLYSRPVLEDIRAMAKRLGTKSERMSALAKISEALKKRRSSDRQIF